MRGDLGHGIVLSPRPLDCIAPRGRRKYAGVKRPPHPPAVGDVCTTRTHVRTCGCPHSPPYPHLHPLHSPTLWPRYPPPPREKRARLERYCNACERNCARVKHAFQARAYELPEKNGCVVVVVVPWLGDVLVVGSRTCRSHTRGIGRAYQQAPHSWSDCVAVVVFLEQALPMPCSPAKIGVSPTQVKGKQSTHSQRNTAARRT